MIQKAFLMSLSYLVQAWNLFYNIAVILVATAAFRGAWWSLDDFIFFFIITGSATRTIVKVFISATKAEAFRGRKLTPVFIA